MKKLMLAGLLALAALSSCADLSKYTKMAGDLVTQFSPQIGDLIKQGEGLLAKTSALPPGLPGAGDVVTKLAANQTSLKGLQSSLDGLKGKVDDAVKAGDAKALDSLLAEQTKLTKDGVTAGADKLKVLSGEVAGLETKAAEAKAAAEAAAKAAAEAAKPFEKKLPNGFNLTGAGTGVEAGLVAFIEDASKPADKTTWFNFDRVTFKTGSAAIDFDKSKSQLTNTAEILKAYPKVKLKIGGYTDNQGAAAANKKISADRAAAVAKALTGLGVAASRLETEGYGQENPVCPANDTDACRAQNRRVAVRVSAK